MHNYAGRLICAPEALCRCDAAALLTRPCRFCTVIRAASRDDPKADRCVFCIHRGDEAPFFSRSLAVAAGISIPHQTISPQLQAARLAFVWLFTFPPVGCRCCGNSCGTDQRRVNSLLEE
ncbi:hypothetical protein LJC23_02160 [Desulfovibrio sp. OttesenSCG-928-I05]|nr:hypothetical protein [Desulfovibrio sp. OttesenSCG-928-I05]